MAAYVDVLSWSTGNSPRRDKLVLIQQSLPLRRHDMRNRFG